MLPAARRCQGTSLYVPPGAHLRLDVERLLQRLAPRLGGLRGRLLGLAPLDRDRLVQLLALLHLLALPAGVEPVCTRARTRLWESVQLCSICRPAPATLLTACRATLQSLSLAQPRGFPLPSLPTTHFCSCLSLICCWRIASTSAISRRRASSRAAHSASCEQRLRTRHGLGAFPDRTAGVQTHTRAAAQHATRARVAGAGGSSV